MQLVQYHDIHDAGPIFYYSLFLNVFDLNAVENFLVEPKERGGQHVWASLTATTLRPLPLKKRSDIFS